MGRKELATRDKTMSCVQCRKSKVKCDREIPCGQCKLRGRAAKCVPVRRTVVDNNKGNISSTYDAPAYESNRILDSTPFDKKTTVNEVKELLSSALDKLQHVSNSDLAINPQENSDDATLYGNKMAKADTPCSQESYFDKPHLLSKVEHTVMGFLPYSESDPVAQQQDTRHYDKDIEKLLPRVDRVQFNSMALDFLQAVRPEVAHNIVNYFFDSLQWLTRVLNTHDSQPQYLKMASASAGWILDNVRPSCICCYITVLALGLHFAPPSYLLIWKCDVENSSVLSKKLIRGCHRMIWSFNFLGSPDIDFLACTVMMSLYPYDEGEAGYISWTLLGAEIKLAQSLGCHRLDDPRFEFSVYPELSQAVQRELGRRIYWNLIWFDWSYSTVTNTYSILPMQTFTKPPSNAIISETGEIIEKHTEEYSDTTYLSFSIRYVEVCRQITDTRLMSGGELDVTQTKSFSIALDLIHDSIPNVMKYSENDNKVYGINRKRSLIMEKCMLEIMFQNRILQLHRLHQLEGHHQEKWDFARRKSVSSARRIVEIVTKFSVQYPELLKYYLIIYYVLGAATTLMIEMCCSSRDNASDLELTRISIRDARKLLNSTQQYSQAAKSSEIVVDEFLKAENTIRKAFMEEETINLMSRASDSSEGSKLRVIFRNILKKAFIEHLREVCTCQGTYPSCSSNLKLDLHGTKRMRMSTDEPDSQYPAENMIDPEETSCTDLNEENNDILRLLTSVFDM